MGENHSHPSDEINARFGRIILHRISMHTNTKAWIEKYADTISKFDPAPKYYLQGVKLPLEYIELIAKKLYITRFCLEGEHLDRINESLEILLENGQTPVLEIPWYLKFSILAGDLEKILMNFRVAEIYTESLRLNTGNTWMFIEVVKKYNGQIGVIFVDQLDAELCFSEEDMNTLKSLKCKVVFQ